MTMGRGQVPEVCLASCEGGENAPPKRQGAKAGGGQREEILFNGRTYEGVRSSDRSISHINSFSSDFGGFASWRRISFRRGFTLIELIVAMGMVAILSISLYASLRVAFNAKNGAEAAVEPARTAALTMEFLRQDFQNAMPVGDLSQSFEGTDGQDDRGRDGDDVNFYSTADGPQHIAGNGEIKNIELAIVTPQGTTDHVLVRRVIRNLLSQVQVNPDEEVLCRGVGGFNVRYYDGSEWLDTWDSTAEDNTLPVAVEVTLTLDRPVGSGDLQPRRFVRIFPLSCSTAAFDTTVNPSAG